LLRLGKIFHDWKEKLADVTKCIGQVQSTSGLASTLSTESRDLNRSKLSSPSTLGTPSPRSPYFGRAKRKSKAKPLDTVTEKPTSEALGEKTAEDVGEKIENEDQEGTEKKETKEEDLEEEADYEDMTLEELTNELEAWYYNFSYTMDGLDSNLAEEVSKCR